MLNSVQVADRRDYVISCIANPLAISSGPLQITVSLDTDFPWMWTGFYLGSLYSGTANGGGGFITISPFQLTFNILDSNRNYYFSDFVPADVLDYALTSSSVGVNKNEIYVLNPEQPQPAGGSFVVYANNLSGTGTLFFELILTGYKIKDDCLKSEPPSKSSPVANLMGSRL